MLCLFSFPAYMVCNVGYLIPSSQAPASPSLSTEEPGTDSDSSAPSSSICAALKRSASRDCRYCRWPSRECARSTVIYTSLYNQPEIINMVVLRSMGAHQCGNDRPGFGMIAISWEIAIKRVFTTKEVLGVLISLSCSLFWSTCRSFQIRISMQGNVALSPFLTGPRVLLPRDAASNYGSMHITPSH